MQAPARSARGALTAPAAREQATKPRRKEKTSRVERRAKTAASLPPAQRADYERLMDAADVLMNVGRRNGRHSAGANQVAAAKRLKKAARAIAASGKVTAP